jgi:serine/threonine protein kinase
VTNEKFALKVLRDNDKARREVELHYESSVHKNIVNIADVYENAFNGTKCLLVVVEFLSGGDLLTRFENQKNRPYSEKGTSNTTVDIGRLRKFEHSKQIYDCG